MPIEALIWSLLLILSPGLASRIWPLLKVRAARTPIDVEIGAPWLHSVLLPYLAIILGSVSGRQVGLYGFTSGEWVAGLLACVLSLGGMYLILARTELKPTPSCPLERILQEEIRWGFYRGAGMLWLRGIFSPLIGLGLALLELALTHGGRSGLVRPSPSQWKTVFRSIFSTFLFLTLGNFWLTAATQLTLAIIMERNALQ